jgi:chemotaxis protein MotC
MAAPRLKSRRTRDRRIVAGRLRASALRICVSVVLAMAIVGSARAAEPERTISQLMSDLQRLQAQMAFGDKAAYALQRDRLRAIGAAILAAKPETWKDKNETDAAVAYVLSGGQPRIIAQLLEKGDIPANEQPLMRGAQDYVSGNQAEAQSLLGDIDPRKSSLKLAGQLLEAWSRRPRCGAKFCSWATSAQAIASYLSRANM